MLQLVNISREYKQKKGPTVKALDNVNLTFNEKGLIFILGKSGSGKSTLLNVIGGLDRYTNGELFIKGKSANNFKQNEFDSYRNTMIGFIFQEYNLLNDFTVGQNIAIALELQGKKASNEAVNEYLTLLDMHGYAHRKTNTLSGGQKQRVAIARALIKQPDIIMADEPTGALDSNTGRQLFEILRKLAEHKLVIVVTHDHEFAETYGDRIIEFSDGKIIRDITKEVKEGEKNITFNQDSIDIAGNYQLTSEDFEKINAYIEQKKSGVKIQIANETDFIASPPVTPYPPTNEIKLLKSRLPSKAALKMGVNALKHKRFRLVLSIILASIAFGMFGFTNAMANFNAKNVTLDEMINQDISSSQITKVNRYSHDEENYYENELKMTPEDILHLNEQNLTESKAVPLIPFVVSFENNLPSSEESRADKLLGTLANYSSNPMATYFESETELKLISGGLLHGHMPSAKGEVAIPSSVASLFTKYGYIAEQSGTVQQISNPGILLNKTLFPNKKIVGVYDSGFDNDKFLSLFGEEDNFLASLSGSQPPDYINSGLHNVYLVSEVEFNETTNSPSYYLTAEGWSFNGELEVVTLGETNIQNVDSARKIEELAAAPNILFIGSNSASMTFSKNDVVIPYSLVSDSLPSLENKLTTIKNGLLATADNDSVIADFLEVYGPFYNIISFDPNPLNWSNAEKSEYREAYYNALFDESQLFTSNEFQNDKPGSKLILPLLQTELSLLTNIPVTLNYSEGNRFMFDEEVPRENNLNIVGLYLDISSILNPGYYTSNFYITEALAKQFGYLENGVFPSALLFHGAGRANITPSVEFAFRGFNASEAGIFYRLKNQVTTSINFIDNLMSAFSQIFTVLGVIFAVFAALLLMNFITLSVSFKKQEVGILRAIGARGIDVSRIFMYEAGVIGLINFALATIILFIGGGIFNNYFMQTLGTSVGILSVGIQQIGLILLLSLAVSLISSFVPVFRLTLKKPIDAIKNS